MKIRYAISSTVATGALILSSFVTPVFAETSIEVSGNGADSNNRANVTTTQNTTVVQSNAAQISNNVNASASTGGNDANDNTGGDVVIDTGNATTTVDVSTLVNKNIADVNNCDCLPSTDVLISGNGADSNNRVRVNSSNSTDAFQDNWADIDNNVNANAKTGYNDANRNTGGDVTVVTGHADSRVDVLNAANANILTTGNGSNGNGGGLSARILGNGADSNNRINLSNDRSVIVAQGNAADIDNWVDVNASTGYNDANDNTGGDVVVGTGNALATARIRNLANFNAADVDCGCLMDVDAKISGNGFNSNNRINARLADNEWIFQGGQGAGNWADINNWLDQNAKTGKNDVNRNTGDVEGAGDPAVITGHADSRSDVSNLANLNVIGSSLPDFEFDFDMGSVWALLMHHSM